MLINRNVLFSANRIPYSCLHSLWGYCCLVSRDIKQTKLYLHTFFGCFGRLSGIIYINPVYELGYWVLLPLLLDYYSIPYFALIFIRHITRWHN